MMKSIRLFAVGLLAALGCSEEFNPVVEGERPYAVFALLNASTPVQVIRVHDTFPPSEQHPGNPPVPGTVVTVMGPNGSFVFRDTLLVPPVGSADTATIPAFVASPFTPLRGQTYQLQVANPVQTVQATLQVPHSAGMSSNDFLVLQGPYGYDPDRGIIVQVLLSPAALGFVVRFVVEYERLINGVWTLEYVEVPYAYQQIIDDSTFTAEYPSLGRRSTRIVPIGSGFRDYEAVTFRNSAYLQTLSILYIRYGKDNLRMKRAMFIATQADTHFFTYYSYANFFQDKFTIRVDQPDYSNIPGALGFFGSMSNDTLAFSLPLSLAPIDSP